MNAAPLVGIVISTLNAEEHLQECLNSIFAQSDSSWEIVVIDGGSSDNTCDVIARNAPRLKYWQSEHDSGVYDAWNKALPHLSASWILFLGADDFLVDPNVFARMRPMLEMAEGVHRIVYGRVEVIDKKGKHLEFLGEPWRKIAKRFRRANCIPHQGVFQHLDLFKDCAGFDPAFRFAGDYEFLLRYIFRWPPLFCDICIAAWRHGGLTSRPDLNLNVFKEFRVARERHLVSFSLLDWDELKAYAKYWLFRFFGPNVADGLVNIYRIATGRRSRNS